LNKKKPFFFVGLSLILICFIIKFSGGKVNSYLSFNKPIDNAKILIVEGWLDQRLLNTIPKKFEEGKYDYLVTTGVLCSEYFNESMNGDLIFKVRATPGKHLLKIYLYGSSVVEEISKFEVYINQNKIGGSESKIRPQYYNFSFNSTEAIDSVVIRFVNDWVKGNEDRNLYIRSMIQHIQ
jgi:hypothetical protein